MHPINVMVNGIPGNVAGTVARHVRADARFELLPFSLTGPEIVQAEAAVEGRPVRLIRPGQREAAIAEIRQQYGQFLSVDYTHPTAVNANAEFYCRGGCPSSWGPPEATATTSSRPSAAPISPPWWPRTWPSRSWASRP